MCREEIFRVRKIKLRGRWKRGKPQRRFTVVVKYMQRDGVTGEDAGDRERWRKVVS